MSSLRFIAPFILSFTLISAALAGNPPRPPQFVEMAFDGSQTLSAWQDTRDFAKSNGNKWTYFMSGVYWLTRGGNGFPNTTSVYSSPSGRHTDSGAPIARHGASDIGWSEASADILPRIGHANAAFDEGNEIGSHANGHFDGSNWNDQDWNLEFDQFNSLIFGAFNTDRGLRPGPTDPQRWNFTEKDIVGFRAPLLGVSEGLWPALRSHHFRYDTSKVQYPSYWPDKKAGFWNFPLSSLKIAGTGKGTLSMDYNFYVAQSGAKPDSANSAVYEQQMYETYLRYFMANYNGNRAPLHIGHHFSRWNGGAYWRALKHFSATVCKMPEVRCVTYRELADFMDTLDAPTLAAYQKGTFDKSPAVNLATNLRPAIDVDLVLSREGDTSVRAAITGSELAAANALRPVTSWELNGETIASATGKDTLDLATASVPSGNNTLAAVVRAADGSEILRATHTVRVSTDGIVAGRDGVASFTLTHASEESKALLGDLPAAHQEQ